MILNPTREFFPRQISGGKGKDRCFGIVVLHLQLVTVEFQEDRHCHQSDTLIPVNERVVRD